MSEAPSGASVEIARLNGFSKLLTAMFLEARRHSPVSPHDRLTVFALFAGAKCAELGLEVDDEVKGEIGAALYIAMAGNPAKH